MTPFEIAEEQAQGRCPSATGFAALAQHGVRALHLARDFRGLFDIVLVDRVKPVGAASFEFYREHGSEAFTLLLRNGLLDPADIVAFDDKGAVRLWLNRLSMLGEDQLNGYRLDDALPVHETIFDWLIAERRGIVILDARRAARALLDGPPLLAASLQHGRQLRDTLTIPPPRVFLPAAQGRRAA